MDRALPRDAGVSLIEIMLAVSIIAIVSAAIVVSMAGPRDPLVLAGERLALRLHHASQEAVVSGQPVGLVIEDFGSGYSFQRYVDGRWWAVEDHPTLQPHTLDNGLRLDVRDAILASEDPDVIAALPSFWFDPAGLTEPFALTLENRSDRIDLQWDAGRLIVSAGDR